MISTKKEYQTMMEVQGAINFDPFIIRKIVLMLKDIGAFRDLPASKQDKDGYLSHFHQSLSVDNPLFPPDVPFDIVYDIFFKDLVNGMAERKGNNLAAIIDAFNRWYPSNKARIYQRYHSEFPSARPKQLSGRKRCRTIAEFTDEEVETTLRAYREVASANGGQRYLENIKSIGERSFYHRLVAEWKKRNPNFDSKQRSTRQASPYPA